MASRLVEALLNGSACELAADQAVDAKRRRRWPTPLPYRYHAGTLPIASRVECVIEPGGVRQARPMIPGADGEATRTAPEASQRKYQAFPNPAAMVPGGTP